MTTELLQREHFLRLLNEITMTCLQPLELYEMLQLLADHMTTLFQAAGCYITLWDDKNSRVIPAAATGPARATYRTTPVMNDEITMTASVLAVGKALVANDVHNSPYISPRIARRFPEKSMLGLPLIAGNQRLGAALVTFDEYHEFTPEEVLRGEQVAGQLSMVVANARLLEALRESKQILENRVRQRTEELEAANLELQAEVAERKRAEERLTRRLQDERALLAITARFMRPDQFDLAVEEALQLIGSLIGASRVTLMRLDPHEKRVKATHEWDAPGIPSQREALTRIPSQQFVWGMHQVENLMQFHIPDVTAMPDEAAAEREYLLSLGVKSFAGFPLLSGGAFLGMLMIEDVQQADGWEQADLDLLSLYNQIIASALSRKETDEILNNERMDLSRRVEERTAELSAANAELAWAVRAKDEFLANMSHELRTPLNAIISIMEALQDQVYGEINERQSRAFDMISTSGKHLLSMINDILDLAKIEAGKSQLQPAWVDVKELCHACLQMIRQPALVKDLNVAFSASPHLNLIWADERRMKQILVNLLGNAVKFTPARGTIGLEVALDPERELVRFTVHDNGIGISKEDLGRLFKPFVQVDSSLTRQHVGSGLGLALVASLTEAHHGCLSVESEPGIGSRFMVDIPYVAPAPPTDGSEGSPTANVLPASASPDQHSPLILLVEDQETNSQIVADYLHFKGYRLVLASDGQAAVTQVSLNPPDLILMDIQMPVMDGLEATRRIRQMPGMQHVPIVALTALAMPGDRERCLDAGATEYMSKPISLKQMHALVERLTRPATFSGDL